mmetsp:Transcript_58761/g.135525  ORF Transcript_58761/g.135525 Transcript_58761/m.135525 type:complete len:651 (-) Transcript_58761:250-2202(-)|eukprot:CAMPEP_0204394350 /NCGR_PEP_ID=MMETSP0469-20131031/62791_1 /ASSEMBLY_ACC=CAM_ASM_000384 /TAXON_ID=2969 /ORGANISM="Oxyrrhis marina" /LENGTH=650 /DNA_ID=CAMNT_0051388459 /DNA_START=83 /DNA_END=2035 /DNA_ORIENTATION=+
MSESLNSTKLVALCSVATIAASVASTTMLFYVAQSRGEKKRAEPEEEEEESQTPAELAADDEADLLQKWLGQGGDDRLAINPKTGMNKYNTPLAPVEGSIRRSSCTSNVPSKFAFDQGKRTVRMLLDASGDQKSIYTNLARKIRMHLCSVWGYRPDSSAINLCPSGTDAEFIPLLLALGRAITNPPQEGAGGVFTVIAAAGEVGSGTVNAAMGRHFGTVAPNVGPVREGDNLFDWEGVGVRPVASTQILLRDYKTGALKAPGMADAEVENVVTEALTSLGYGVCVVHIVIGTKTGHQLPSISCVNRLVRQFGRRVVPVVDACQGRLQEGSVQDFLDNEMCVLCTGSKFYGGPPFSGAALISNNHAHELETMLATSDQFRRLVETSKLAEYFDAPLMSDMLPGVTKAIQQSREPTLSTVRAVCLRWTLALHEIERYHAIPQLQLDGIIREWVREVRKLITDLGTPCIQLICDKNGETVTSPGHSTPSTCSDDDTFMCHKSDLDKELDARYHPGKGDEVVNTIVSIALKHGEKNPTALTLNQYKLVHRLMAMDLRSFAPQVCQRSRLPPKCIERLLQTRCFMAQPVTIAKDRHIIRVAMSAAFSWECYEQERFFLQDVHGTVHPGIKASLEDDSILFEKLLLILENWQVFQE